jgi:hypothetical protein
VAVKTPSVFAVAVATRTRDARRFKGTTAKSRKNYAGTSHLTVASGRKRAVLARHVRNRRLYDAIDQWALCALNTSPGARHFYDDHRAAGDWRTAAMLSPSAAAARA